MPNIRPTEPALITRAVLDGMQTHCEVPNCTEPHDEVYLHPSCHIDSPTWVVYKAGILRIICARCESIVGRIEIKG